MFNNKNTQADDGMERGGYFTKKNGSKPVAKGFFRFLEKEFDWIVLILMTIIVLFVLVFFSV